MSQLIYVISKTNYRGDEYSSESDEEIIIAFVDSGQAVKFINDGKENEYQKLYNMACITLID